MRSGKAVERPQSRKTEIVAPIVDRRTTDVTWKRSQSIPIIMVDNTPEALSSATRRVPIEGDRPSERANVGR